MEIYGGPRDDWKFRTSGVPSAQRKRYAQITNATIESTELALGFMAYKLGMNELFSKSAKVCTIEISLDGDGACHRIH
jgi:hypothetical protein